MPSKHTPEPWPDVPVPVLTQEDYDRARECVNACAGMDDPAAAIRAAREALRGLLTTDTYWIDDCIERANDGDDDADALWKQIQKARSALAGLGGAE